MTDGYTNRADYAADGDECKRSPTCQLIDDHGGDCDDRPEQKRWKALYAKLDGRLPGET